jgi:hypothetical protein
VGIRVTAGERGMFEKHRQWREKNNLWEEIKKKKNRKNRRYRRKEGIKE